MKFSLSSFFLLFTIFFIQLQPVESQECYICQTIVSIIQGWINDEETIEQIEEYLAQLCQYLPTPWDSVCERMEHGWLLWIIQWLQLNETPDVICAQIGYCTATKTDFVPSYPNCLLIFKQIEMMSNPMYGILCSPSEIETFLQKEVCSHASNKESKMECHTLIGSLFQAWNEIKLYEREGNPSVVCNRIIEKDRSSLCRDQVLLEHLKNNNFEGNSIVEFI